jgi:hypothetical protein
MRILAIFFIFLVSGCVYMKADKGDIGTLLDIKRSEESEKEYLKKASENFERAVTKINTGEIKIGVKKTEVVQKIGDPLLQYKKAGGETFVYRPSEDAWFKGKKVYLYFDSNGQLARWQCFHTSCENS